MRNPQSLKLPELIILGEHCGGIEIAITSEGSIVGYVPCARCNETGDWCGEHKIIEVGSMSRKTQIATFRKSYDRARAGGLIPIPVEHEPDFRNVIPIRRGA